MNIDNRITLVIPQDKGQEYLQLKKDLEKNERNLRRIVGALLLLISILAFFLFYPIKGPDDFLYFLGFIASFCAVIAVVSLFGIFPFRNNLRENKILIWRIKDIEIQACRTRLEDIFFDKEEANIQRVVEVFHRFKDDIFKFEENK